MKIKIALAGNPNSGKTTLFNSLTGSNQYVGNWPGVTVEKKEGVLKGNKDVIIQDLPGIYSLSPYTLEEVVARNYLTKENPDAIINIVDGTNIERNLYLTTQLIELGLPVIVAINMIDIVRKNGDEIDLTKLSNALGCPVVSVSALKGIDTDELTQKAIELAKSKKSAHLPHVFEGACEHAVAHIEESIEEIVPSEKLRWYAIKLFERDEKVLEELSLDKELMAHLEQHIAECEAELDDDSESIITNQRYAYIKSVTTTAIKKKNHGHLSISDRIDLIVTNRFLALPIFALIMFLVYYISVSPGGIGTYFTDYVNDVIFTDIVPPAVTTFLEGMGVSAWLVSLIVDGVIAGVGAVLGFVPQLLVLFLMLSALEDCGYMARVAFIMDRIFRKFGLSGKSFIPMLIGSGCSVPGIMASRTIEQERDRRMTIMTTAFIPCGAKIPIIALIAGAIFNEAWWVAPLAYFIGVAAVIISGIILKKTKMFSGNPAPFVMELPSYHIPALTNVLKSTWERGSSFIKRAGTVILLSTIIIWFLQGFGFVDGKFMMVSDNSLSLLAMIGMVIAPIFAPIGFGFWQAAVGTFTGLVAKENLVATLGILYGFAEVSEAGNEYWSMMANDFTVAAGLSFLIFNLLCAPCFAAIGAIKREMNNTKWTSFAVFYMCAFAYVVSFIVYQIGTAFAEKSFGIMPIIAIAILVYGAYLLFVKKPFDESSVKIEAKKSKN